MADGSGHDTQGSFGFPQLKGLCKIRPGEIVVDLFAGGGGASTAIEQALGHPVDIALNHNPWAVGLHAVNHPLTRHLCQDVWEADPRVECAGRPVALAHFSPDCTHHSQARGGQPRSRAIRSLSWVTVRWAAAVRPRIITLENVSQLLKWGPLIAKRCKETGRVYRIDGTVAAVGEQVPVSEQFLIPDPKREGQTWRHFVSALEDLGYRVEWRRLKACDFGAGTTRERLFMVARCDGEPICWPTPTHGPGRAHPFVTAADSIDWTVECPSIFKRKRPLAEATLRRIARGIRRYVLDAPEPFVVGVGGRMGQSIERGVSNPMQTVTTKADSAVVTPALLQCANASASGIAAADAPLGTVTAWPRGGAYAVSAPVLVQAAHGEGRADGVKRWGLGANSLGGPVGTVTASGSGGYALASATLAKFRGDSIGTPMTDPVPVITSGAGAARPAGAAHALGVVSAFLEQAAGGPNSNSSRPRGAEEPVSTITQSGSQQRLCTASLATLRGTNIGAPATAPVRTITAGGEHHAVVECSLSPEVEESALRVAALLRRLEGGQASDEPLAPIVVMVKGVAHVIVDIGLRMLRPRELLKAQGFPSTYVIERTADGRAVSNSRAVAMIGNSVSPHPLAALLRANLERAEEADSLALAA